MEQEQQADQRDDEALLEQGRAQRLDRTHDEVGPVVDRLPADALRQAARKFRALVLYPADHGQGVLAEARNDYPGHNTPFTVKFGDPATLVGPQSPPGHVPAP